MPKRDWSELSEGAKKFNRERGINAGTYNKWWGMSQTERTDLTRAAKKSGYDSGLQFLAIQGQVRTWTNKRIQVTTKPQEAARKLLEGTPRTSKRRAIIPKLFDFAEFDRLEWTEFLSP